MPETKESSSQIEAEVDRWEQKTLGPALERYPERKKSFQTVSLEEVNRLYTPADIENVVAITPEAASGWAKLAFWDILVFFGVLMVGFAYLWRRGDIVQRLP